MKSLCRQLTVSFCWMLTLPIDHTSSAQCLSAPLDSTHISKNFHKFFFRSFKVRSLSSVIKVDPLMQLMWWKCPQF